MRHFHETQITLVDCYDHKINIIHLFYIGSSVTHNDYIYCKKTIKLFEKPITVLCSFSHLWETDTKSTNQRIEIQESTNHNEFTQTHFFMMQNELNDSNVIL